MQDTKDVDSASDSPQPKKVCRQGYIYDGQNRTAKWPEERISQSISVKTRHVILTFMEQYTKDVSRIDKEWTYICNYTPDYLNKLPKQLKISVNGYQYLTKKMTQITLHDPKLNKRENYDYSNASFIYDSNPKQPVFIASQSPMPSTINQFWRMIWDSDVTTIVMLSINKDKGDVKGCRYWPREGIQSYGQFEVCVVSKHAVCPNYLVRSFYVKECITGSSRTVTQFQFKSWDDIHVPSDLPSFLEFRRKVQRSSITNPIVVHCRDGLGRSGLYILLDLALRKLIREADKMKELDMCALLEFLRDQRPGFVSNQQQYEFSIAAFSEEVYTMMTDGAESGTKEYQPLLQKLQQQLFY